MQQGRDIIYFDETTAHIWEKRTKVWQHPSDPIVQRIPNRRGSGTTILGAISTLWGRMNTTTGVSTCSEEVLLFFKSMMRLVKIPSNAVVVMDNHKSHGVPEVVDFLQSKGVIIHYLPPNASFLNPIERMWAYFKNSLARRLMPHNGLVGAESL